MGIRTGAQYINGLKSRQPEIWLSGRKVTHVCDEVVFQQPIREIAKLYDMQHDPEYQERRGILQGPAEGLTPELTARIQSLAKRICRTLALDGYARIDFRLTAEGVPYFLEANPNPEIAQREEFAQAAEYDGLKYPDLLNRILALGLSRAKRAEVPLPL